MVTPEVNLWTAVLRTFIEDAFKLQRNSRRGVFLLPLAESEQTKEICTYAGVDHDHFVETIKKILGGKHDRSQYSSFRFGD